MRGLRANNIRSKLTVMLHSSPTSLVFFQNTTATGCRLADQGDDGEVSSVSQERWRDVPARISQSQEQAASRTRVASGMPPDCHALGPCHRVRQLPRSSLRLLQPHQTDRGYRVTARPPRCTRTCTQKNIIEVASTDSINGVYKA